MATLKKAAPAVKPIAPSNPRDSWPAWTGRARWGLGPDAGAIPDDGPRPTAGPDFEPTPEESAIWSALRSGPGREG